MKYRTRIYYSEARKALMWERWQKGDSMRTIARFLDQF
jgi:IS30 family transposase